MALMSSAVEVALITAGAALAVSLTSFPLDHLINQRVRRAQTLDLMARYRDPLLWAVHDLRSRVRSILEDDYFNDYLVNAEERIFDDEGAFMRAT